MIRFRGLRLACATFVAAAQLKAVAFVRALHALALCTPCACASSLLLALSPGKLIGSAGAEPRDRFVYARGTQVYSSTSTHDIRAARLLLGRPPRHRVSLVLYRHLATAAASPLLSSLARGRAWAPPFARVIVELCAQRSCCFFTDTRACYLQYVYRRQATPRLRSHLFARLAALAIPLPHRALLMGVNHCGRCAIDRCSQQAALIQSQCHPLYIHQLQALFCPDPTLLSGVHELLTQFYELYDAKPHEKSRQALVNAYDENVSGTRRLVTSVYTHSCHSVIGNSHLLNTDGATDVWESTASPCAAWRRVSDDGNARERFAMENGRALQRSISTLLAFIAQPAPRRQVDELP